MLATISVSDCSFITKPGAQYWHTIEHSIHIMKYTFFALMDGIFHGSKHASFIPGKQTTQFGKEAGGEMYPNWLSH